MIRMQKYKKSLPKLIFSLVMLIVAGYLVYNNFIKKEFFLYLPAEEIDKQDLSRQFDLDVFESDVFKSLVKAKKLIIPSVERIGRENPFLKF